MIAIADFTGDIKHMPQMDGSNVIVYITTECEWQNGNGRMTSQIYKCSLLAVLQLRPRNSRRCGVKSQTQIVAVALHSVGRPSPTASVL